MRGQTTHPKHEQLNPQPKPGVGTTPREAKKKPERPTGENLWRPTKATATREEARPGATPNQAPPQHANSNALYALGYGKRFLRAKADGRKPQQVLRKTG